MSRQLGTGQFYGEVIQRSAWSGAVLTELRHTRARRLPMHSHEAAYFCLLLDGAYREQVGRQTIEYRPFTVGFHPAGIRHNDEIGPNGGLFFCVELEDWWFERLHGYVSKVASAPELHGGEMVWLAARLYREARDSGVAASLAIEGILLEMLAEAAKASVIEERQTPGWLARVVDLLHAEFSNHLTIARLAAEVAVHPVHLSRVFRKTYGQTLGEYVARLRVRFASEQLATREVELSELALAAGFADQSHFTRVFKRITGKTPGVFRASNEHRS